MSQGELNSTKPMMVAHHQLSQALCHLWSLRYKVGLNHQLASIPLYWSSSHTVGQIQYSALYQPVFHPLCKKIETVPNQWHTKCHNFLPCNKNKYVYYAVCWYFEVSMAKALRLQSSRTWGHIVWLNASTSTKLLVSYPRRLQHCVKECCTYIPNYKASHQDLTLKCSTFNSSSFFFFRTLAVRSRTALYPLNQIQTSILLTLTVTCMWH